MSNTYNALIHAKQDGTGEEVANNLSGGGGSDVSPEVEAILNVYGSKNLIPYPYEQTTKTESGITFTDNGNGTVTVNGTATDTTIFTIHSSNSFILNNGTYTMNGCPNGGSTNSYYHVIQYTNSNNQSIYIYDTGDGTEFTLNGSYGRPDDASILQGIVIIAGTTVNNLTFRPMIRDARITDPTWVPFAMTNKQLTESVKELNSKIIYNSISRNEKVTVNGSSVIKTGYMISITVSFTTSESLPAWSDLVSLPFNTKNFTSFIIDYNTSYYAKDANTNDLIVVQNTSNPSIMLGPRPLHAGQFEIRCIAMIS